LGVAAVCAPSAPYRKAWRSQKITSFPQPVHDTVAEELPHEESVIEEPPPKKTNFKHLKWLEEFGWLRR
jgi:hypothetical protein